jgi:uncharacterized membrane protein YeaQ/YmgE (transglycosylase-associated protein family)
MVYIALIVLTSPFGWIAGQLSAINRTMPFILNMILFAIGIVLVWFIGRLGFLRQPSLSAPVIKTSPPAESENDR